MNSNNGYDWRLVWGHGNICRCRCSGTVSSKGDTNRRKQWCGNAKQVVHTRFDQSHCSKFPAPCQEKIPKFRCPDGPQQPNYDCCKKKMQIKMHQKRCLKFHSPTRYKIIITSKSPKTHNHQCLFVPGSVVSEIVFEVCIQALVMMRSTQDTTPARCFELRPVARDIPS